MRSLEQRVAEIADEVLEALLLSEESNVRTPRDIVGLIQGPNLWPSDFHLVDKLAGDLEGGGRYYLLPDVGELPPVWPLDIAFVVKGGEGRLIAPGAFGFFRVVTVQPPEVRNMVRLVPPHMATVFQGKIEANMREAWSEIHGRVGGRWMHIERHDNLEPTAWVDPEMVTRSLMTAQGMALTERYSWHVAFGYSETSGRLVVPTNPTGCLALYRSREPEPGRSRRAALRHWVTSHYRGAGGDDPDALTWVREHLRGNLSFIWNGLFCELMVSDYDLEKNEFFKTQAAEWRSQRGHNRFKVRLKVRR